ncbi:trans-Golgi network integral membrane protein 2 isoform X2 [Harpegnathos saltator]|uniref:trans-Golgi network integral membrane protein 2 isoform X2 n=1 Tax=Harpegnathos saltator TaxID=610380 RepID=UPI0005910D4F|nr:trans-Golgi network integral membrane protein 2 isoform X2 [Harpegnathos saltator]
MENRNVPLFCISYTLNFLVLLFFSTVVTSIPMKESIVDVMKTDEKLCDSIKVLYESKYTNSCASLDYPVQAWDNKEGTLDKYLCLGVYDTAYKVCQYSDHLQIPLNHVAVFDANVEKFVPNEKSFGTEGNNEETYCKDNLQGFTSLYSKVKLHWGPLAERFGKPHLCQRLCFDLNYKFRPLCAVFAWIKSIEDEIKKSKISVTNHDAVNRAPEVSNPKAPVDQEVTADKILETNLQETEKKTEMKKFKEPHDKEKNTSAIIFNEHTQPNTEKAESDLEKSSKHETQKMLNDILSRTEGHNSQDKDKENINNVKTETNPEAPKTPVNVPSKENVDTKEVAKEENAKETNRKPEVDDVKTSTLSENTQDHYGASNGEDEEPIEVDDTIQQPIETGNQNENLQEPFERKNNLRYPNMRAEGDSHFFTYFIVTTVACIACYIGYHNKQKILAIVLEGRRSRNSRGRRRPSTANYRKLDCTLEEAVTSQCNANVTHVIY